MAGLLMSGISLRTIYLLRCCRTCFCALGTLDPELEPPFDSFFLFDFAGAFGFGVVHWLEIGCPREITAALLGCVVKSVDFEQYL